MACSKESGKTDVSVAQIDAFDNKKWRTDAKLRAFAMSRTCKEASRQDVLTARFFAAMFDVTDQYQPVYFFSDRLLGRSTS